MGNVALLLLEDGTFFKGQSFGALGETFGEVVFNTSMCGYQEILTDPSYKYQIVTMTYPMIGNYGINPEDIESDKVQVSGFVVKEYSKTYSNYRAQRSLDHYLKQYNIMGIEGLDTRALTIHLRDKGSMRGILSTQDSDINSLRRKVLESREMTGADLVKEVTVTEPYAYVQKTDESLLAYPQIKSKGNFRVAVYDYGVKSNILRKLNDRNCELKIYPANTPYKDIISDFKPDGFFLSNGPGDPAAVSYAIENIQGILDLNIPTFGICLGHQLLGLAFGGKTYKLKFGHRGGNQPVKNISTDKVEITSQNHGFCVDDKSLPEDVQVTHINLNDNTTEGLRHRTKPVFSVQYHPESSPGPHDSDYLFDEFIEIMNK